MSDRAPDPTKRDQDQVTADLGFQEPDDTLGGREITVSNAEIENAVVVYSDAGQSAEAPFTNRAKSMVELEDC